MSSKDSRSSKRFPWIIIYIRYISGLSPLKHFQETLVLFKIYLRTFSSKIFLKDSRSFPNYLPWIIIFIFCLDLYCVLEGVSLNKNSLRAFSSEISSKNSRSFHQPLPRYIFLRVFGTHRSLSLSRSGNVSIRSFVTIG